MPANTVLLSTVMRELSRQPGFTEALLAQIEGTKTRAEKKGPALLTPVLMNELRNRVFGSDWGGLDRFPGWPMRRINPTVELVDKALSRNPKLEGLSAAHPGAPAPSLSDQQARVFLDLGPYALDRAEAVSLDEPSTLPGFSLADNVTELGHDLQRGDGPNQLAPEHAESQRLADVMNRLSANSLAGAQPFQAKLDGRRAQTPQALVAALVATGHSVSVTDSRYFANFGHLHYRRQDVMMPFWIDTGLLVPGTGGLFRKPRPLLVPVSHAEYEWHVRGPHINADISHYFGVDGKAEWRTMDTLDQAWVLKRNAHTYTGADALEVTRLVGLVTVAYMHQHAHRPALPFGGYYMLGVCQDPVSAIEKKLTGRSTLFPNTADARLFDDGHDSEVNQLFRAIPKDRSGAAPGPERIFGSLPLAPGADGSFAQATIPGLADDLRATYAAWQQGTLKQVQARLIAWRIFAGVALCGVLGFAIWRVKRRSALPES